MGRLGGDIPFSSPLGVQMSRLIRTTAGRLDAAGDAESVASSTLRRCKIATFSLIFFELDDDDSMVQACRAAVQRAGAAATGRPRPIDHRENFSTIPAYCPAPAQAAAARPSAPIDGRSGSPGLPQLLPMRQVRGRVWRRGGLIMTPCLPIVHLLPETGGPGRCGGTCGFKATGELQRVETTAPRRQFHEPVTMAD